MFPHLHADQGLDLALERMGSNDLDLLPVVNRANVHTLMGIVTIQDVLDAYGDTTPEPRLREQEKKLQVAG